MMIGNLVQGVNDHFGYKVSIVDGLAAGRIFCQAGLESKINGGNRAKRSRRVTEKLSLCWFCSSTAISLLFN